MSNHVHVVVRLFPGQELAKVVKAWKNFSAKAQTRRLVAKDDSGSECTTTG
jgi:REP element-mobilizing transposase RayT